MKLREVLLALLLLSLVDCDGEAVTPPPAVDTTCAGLYGRPNANTGLDSDVCFPRIEGDESWSPRKWNSAAFAELLSWTLDAAPEVLTQNPYETSPELEPDASAVCVVLATGDHTYRLKTYSEATLEQSIAAAKSDGGIITHGGACGACSSLADLEVYARIPDQTDPVRKCAMSNLDGEVEEVDLCIQDAVGFTPSCSRAWAYNTINDGEHCRDICLGSVLKAEPYNQKDGSLNGCLQCDEDISGSVFKAIAGRTRRNSGLAAAICRPCATVWRVDHAYK
jgi:hypothetical protein